ncbi:MAG TPA: hypothetical protein VMM54_00860 [Nitrospirota bacterium]|nr:hypothetical protein [Nitrospirota bacterium]
MVEKTALRSETAAYNTPHAMVPRCCGKSNCTTQAVADEIDRRFLQQGKAVRELDCALKILYFFRDGHVGKFTLAVPAPGKIEPKNGISLLPRTAGEPDEKLVVAHLVIGESVGHEKDRGSIDFPGNVQHPDQILLSPVSKNHGVFISHAILPPKDPDAVTLPPGLKASTFSRI